MEVQSKQSRRVEGADNGRHSYNGEVNGGTKAGKGGGESLRVYCPVRFMHHSRLPAINLNELFKPNTYLLYLLSPQSPCQVPSNSSSINFKQAACIAATNVNCIASEYEIASTTSEFLFFSRPETLPRYRIIFFPCQNFTERKLSLKLNWAFDANIQYSDL